MSVFARCSNLELEPQISNVQKEHGHFHTDFYESTTSTTSIHGRHSKQNIVVWSFIEANSGVK